MTGKQLGTLPLNKTDSYPYLRLDSTGKMLAYTPADGDQTTLVEIPSGRVLGVLPSGPIALGPGGSYWVSSLPPPGMTLVRRQDARPLFAIGIEGEVAGDQAFSPDGTRWACGHADGSVTVCDIPAVQRRLADLGLGW